MSPGQGLHTKDPKEVPNAISAVWYAKGAGESSAPPFLRYSAKGANFLLVTQPSQLRLFRRRAPRRHRDAASAVAAEVNHDPVDVSGPVQQQLVATCT